MIACLAYLWRFLALVILLTGCSSLPARIPFSAQEDVAVKEAFREMAGNQRECASGLDADITLSIRSGFYSGTMSGYLQARAPAFLKLVGINPLGQPLIALVCDGEWFDLIMFSDSRGYDGEVDSAAFRKFVPAGFAPTTSFYTLTGKLAPGEVRILATGNDRDGQGAWLELERLADKSRSLVLFDPERLLIRQYLQYDSEGNRTIRLNYSGHDPGPCHLPKLINITSSNYSGELVIKLKDWRPDRLSSATDFALELPPGFKRVTLN